MKRRLSTIALSALAVVAVGGLTVLRTGLAAEAAWRNQYTPLTRNTYPVEGPTTMPTFSSASRGTGRSASSPGTPPR